MKRIMALLLALLTLAGAVVAFTGCNNGGTETNKPESESQKPNESQTATETLTEESGTSPEDEEISDYYRNIPDGVMATGYTFKYFSYDYTHQGDWNIYLAPKDDGNGNKVQSAAFYRNIEVEQKFGCRVTLDYEEVWTSYMGTLSAQIKSGDAPWDLCCFYGSPDHNIASLLAQGLFMDWNKLPYVNLNDIWYNQSANEVYSILGKQFLAVSEITRTVHQHSRMLMNKDLFVAYGHHENEIYDTVKRGNWTYEALNNFIESTYRDTNAKETGKDAGDTFGMVITSSFAEEFIPAAGVIPIVLEDDTFVYNFNSSKISNIIKKLNNFCYDNGNVWHQKPTEENGYNANAVIYSIFEDGRSLFSFYGSDPKYLTSIDKFDYAYLPYPKYDTKQASYITIGSGGLMAVPRNVESRNMNSTGLLIEALSAASRKYVYTKFIEEYFETRILRDPQSLDIYKMMANNATYSIGKYVDPSLEVNGYFSYFIENKTLGVSTRWREKELQIKGGYNKLLLSVKNMK